MSLRVNIGVRDCGHWSSPFQDEINLNTLQEQADGCRSCATVLEWIHTMYTPQCDRMQPAPSGRKSYWRNTLRRIGLGSVRTGWFTLKFMRDLGTTLFLCGLMMAGIVGLVVLLGFAAGSPVINCCRGSADWRDLVYLIKITLTRSGKRGVGWVSTAYRWTLKSILRMLGSNVGYGRDLVAPPSWTEVDDGPYGYMEISDVECGAAEKTKPPTTKLKKESLGKSCIRISSAHPKLNCTIHQHKYNSRGPVGALIYYQRILGELENHPTHLLSLAAGKLFLSVCKF